MWFIQHENSRNTGCPTKKFTFFKSTYLKPLIFLRLRSVLEMNLLENCDFVFLKEDIKRFILSTQLDLRDIRGLRYVDLKKVNFFVGHPVGLSKYSWTGYSQGRYLAFHNTRKHPIRIFFDSRYSTRDRIAQAKRRSVQAWRNSKPRGS